MNEGYRDRVLSALGWSVSGEFAAQATRAGFGVALARLLTPDDFGLVAMLFIGVNFFVLTIDLGFEEALVQRRDITEAHRSSVFWLILLWGLLLTGTMAASASWIAAFYGVEQLAHIGVWLALLFLPQALGAVPRAILARRLRFLVSAWSRAAAVAVGGSCAVAMARLGFGASSLIAQILVAAVLECVLLFIAAAWRPHFRFRLSAVRELFGFSAYRPAMQTLTYWSNNLDQFLVGKFVGSDALGVYLRATHSARFAIPYVVRAISSVMFSSLSLIQDDVGRVRAVYLRSVSAVALATFAIGAGLFAAAEPFVLGIFGPQWRETVPLLRILGLAALPQTLTSLTSSVYLALGRPDLLLRLTVLQRILAIGAVIAAVHWGMLAIAAAQLVSAVLIAAATIYFAARMVHLSFIDIFGPLARILCASMVMAMTVIVAGTAMTRLAPLELLAADVFIGVVVYWGALRLLRVAAYADLLDLARQLARRALSPPPTSRGS